MKKQGIEEQAANIFVKAAAYIRRYGWQEKGMSQDGQPRCSMGALASANPEKRWDEKLSKLMYDSLYRELHGLSLTQFNHRYQSGEKVAQLYEKVANKLQGSSV